MTRFRAKLAEFDAAQLTGQSYTIPGFAAPPPAPAGVAWGEKGNGDPWLYAFVLNRHGERVYLERGDWVVPDPVGTGFVAVSADTAAALFAAVG